VRSAGAVVGVVAMAVVVGFLVGLVGGSQGEEAAPTASRTVSGTPGTPRASAIAVNAVDKAKDAGIYESSTQATLAVVKDFDNDGHSDIFVGKVGLSPKFYLNDGNGHFTETNQGAFGNVDRHGCDAADVNADGLNDLFCAVGAHHGAVIKRNQLFIQQANHTFVDQAAQYGVLQPFERVYDGTFLDANGDAHPDLYTNSNSDRGDGMPSPNRLFVNEGGTAYRPAPEFGLEIASEGSTAEAGDFNGDGWQDLLVQTGVHDAGTLYLYRNDQGHGFTNVANQLGLEQKVLYATLADLNGDGRQDVIAALRSELRVYLSQGETFTYVFSKSVSDGTWVATGDVNGDERPDIYLMRRRPPGSSSGTNKPDVVYLNNGTADNFTEMSIPSTTEGDAESVWPIDYDKNGLTDFLVLNGRSEEGPVQLIAFFPASP
jgi:hypothetical protein